MRNVKIVDTTLRDGEQTAGVAFTNEQKKHIAQLLDNLGVAIIEAGIPAMGKEEIKLINEICAMNLKAEILTWNRMKIEDIEHSIETGCKNVHIAVPTSDLHIIKKLGITREEVIEQMRKVISYAVNNDLNVSIGAEDGSRTEIDFLLRVYLESQKEGAVRIRFADTVGIMNPFDSFDWMNKINRLIDLPIDFHGHNDFGMATANALGAFKGGAEYISCSINGLGERAGNTPLEEIATILEFMEGFNTKIELKKLKEVSKVVEYYSGRTVNKGKPIVGDDVFSHESGIHVDGMIKDCTTYEAFYPECVGAKRKFVLGKHSGTMAIRHLMQQQGVELNQDDINKLLINLRNIKSR